MSDTLTLNEPWARRLRRRHNLAQREHAGVWEAPQILSWERYARETWLQSWPAERLLSPYQELSLWETCLQDDSTLDAGLFDPRQLARLLMQSRQQALRWQIDWQQGPHWSAEQKLFAGIARRFEQRLQEQHWLTAADLPQHCLQAMAAGQISPPAQLDLHGFHLPHSAAAAAFIAGLQDLGTALQHAPHTARQGPLHGHTCSDESSQWLAIAAQLRGLLQSNGDSRIVVAVPRFSEALRRQIDALWREALDPAWIRQNAPSAPTLWGYEHSLSLAEQPAIAAALAAIQLRIYDNRGEAFAALLLNPRLFDDSERGACARLENRLRQQGPRGSINSLRRLLDDQLPARLRQRLQRYLEVVERTPGQASCQDWLQHWQQCWLALGYATSGQGWPLGEEFDQALLHFAALQGHLPALSQNQALSWLREILQTQRYDASETQHAPIRICDLETALALDADHYVLADMSNRHFPLSAQPDPFLNLDEQIASGWPAASAEASLQHARALWQALHGSGTALSVYCPLSNDQGAEQLPSSLLALAWEKADATLPARPASRSQFRQQDPVPPLDADRRRVQRGGIRIVQSQAHGSFFAFARHRLGLSALEPAREGLSPMAQGEWIHAVLQAFWEKHRSQHTLLQMDEDALCADLRPRIEALADRHAPLAQFGQHLQQAECDRILRCCRDWLLHEQRRKDPFVVEHCELALAETLDPFEFRLRIDRVDRCDTANGPRYLVIDYKTSRALETKYWQVHQFYEPQLPLYACSQRLQELDVPQVDGICFAQVQEQFPAFVASLNWRKKLIEDDKRPFHMDWEGQLGAWRQRLNELIDGYCAGGCAIDLNTDYQRRYPVADLLELIDETGDSEEDTDAGRA